MLRIHFGAAALALFAQGAFACDGQTGKVIFEDKFSDDSEGWLFSEDYNLVFKRPEPRLRLKQSIRTVSLIRRSLPRKGISVWKCPSPADAVQLDAAIEVLFGPGLLGRIGFCRWHGRTLQIDRQQSDDGLEHPGE
jgi:hypothetical protein